MRTGGWVPRLYALGLRLLPTAVREADGAEMAATFEALWADAGSTRRRIRLMARAFGRLPVVVLLEWRDHVGEGRGRSGVELVSDRKGAGMESMWRTVRYAARSLGKAPAFTWTVVLLLGLGIGGVTTIYTVVDHVLLRPLPYPDADRLVEVENGAHSGPTFARFQEFGLVDRWAGVTTHDAILTGVGEPLQLQEAQVTRDFMAMFGARPAVGRLPVAEDFRTGANVLALVWGFAVVADSAQFSALVTEVSPRHAVGTALTLQTSLGFALTALSIWLTIELVEVVGWGPAFSMLAAGPVFGVWAMARLAGVRRS